MSYVREIIHMYVYMYICVVSRKLCENRFTLTVKN